MPKGKKIEHPLPKLPQCVVDVSKVFFAEHNLQFPRIQMPDEPIDLPIEPTGSVNTKKSNVIIKSQTKGAEGIILSLPSTKMPSTAKNALPPINVFRCVTLSLATNSGNYSVEVDLFLKNGKLSKISNLRVPSEAIIFPGTPIYRSIIDGAMEVIRETEAAFQDKLDHLISGLTSKVAVPGDYALFFPREGKDLPNLEVPMFSVGRAHLVILTGPQNDGKQAFTTDEMPGENVKVPIKAMIYGLPLHIRRQVKDLISAADQILREKVSAYLMSSKMEAVVVPPPTEDLGDSPADAIDPADPVRPLRRNIRSKARGTSDPQPTLLAKSKAKRTLGPRPSRGTGNKT